jgi:hypothetical protein
VNDDGRIPQPSPIVTRLQQEGLDETDVMALVGFVGEGRGGDVRMYSDIGLQRWMDIPEGAIFASSPIDGDRTGLPGRSVVWVRKETMLEPVFKETSLIDFTADFEGSWMSVWPFIPDTRLLAAQILGLVPRLSDDEGGGGQ